MKIRKAAILTVTALSACTLEPSQVVHTTQQAAESNERVVLNRVVLNRVVLNRVVLNRLAAAALASGAVAGGPLGDGGTVEFNTNYDPNGIDGELVHQTEEGREVLRYMVRCALQSERTLTLDEAGVQYEYDGMLGLADDWLTRALEPLEKELLSACLYAHINHFGASIEMSLRFPWTDVDAGPAEAAQYLVYEGAFMGRYFVPEGEDIEIYSCQGDGYDLAIVNGDTRDQRVCTDASSGCGVTVVGRCRDVCESYVPGYGWGDCWAGGTKYGSVANVFLNAHDPDGANAVCASGTTCKGWGKLDSGPDAVAVLTGTGAANVHSRCGTDSVCIVNNAEADKAKVKVSRNAMAEVNCAATGQCSVRARANSMVEINCLGAGTCDNIICEPGAACLLKCGDNESCGFAQCGTEVVCYGNGLLACNYDGI